MPAVSLTTLPTIPYVYSGTTPSTANKCQLVTLPSGVSGVSITIHNNDKATKKLRISFDGTLTQDGNAPSTYFSVHEPQLVALSPTAASGFPAPTHIALFSDSTSVNYELLFCP
jgi:hypothetical protein